MLGLNDVPTRGEDVSAMLLIIARVFTNNFSPVRLDVMLPKQVPGAHLRLSPGIALVTILVCKVIDDHISLLWDY
jgi:hypothetical protein